MKIKKIHLLVFSPCGHTGRAVEAVAGAWDGLECDWVDLCDRETAFADYSFAGDELCVVGVPSYGGRVPPAALARLLQMRASRAPTVALVTYGMRAYEDTLLELKNALEQRGCVCCAGIAALSEHSICPSIGAGRPNGTDSEELKQFGLRIREMLENAALPGFAKMPGKIPYRELAAIPLKPSTGSACTQCGICATNCPVGAIPLSNPRFTDKEECISCMRCIVNCPRHARSLSKLMLFFASRKLNQACSRSAVNELFLPAEKH